MLDVARVLRQRNDRFDSVVFFDATPEDIIETQKRIPGAIGFPGKFADIVLLEDPDEDSVIDGLESPAETPESRGGRDLQRRLTMRRDFIRTFPFDVLNLDLYDFLFRPTDPPPGKLIAALRKVCAWQKRAIDGVTGAHRYIDGFSLMFTTRIGPPNISDEYRQMLRGGVVSNLEQDPSLIDVLTARVGNGSVEGLENAGFDVFFKLAISKLLAAMFMEEDWHVDSTEGIVMYEFERPGEDPYKMLHLVMDVRRNDPPKERRRPGEVPDAARNSYKSVVRQIFERPEILVTPMVLNKETLELSLQRINARRKKYYPEGVGLP